MSDIITSKLDPGQIIRRSYDDDKNRIRVDAEVEAVIAPVEIVIDAASGDNIAIADQTGTNYLAVQNDGSINVNANIELNHTEDSVAIGDGTNLVSVDPTTGALLVTLNQTNLTTKNYFGEVDNVVSGVTEVIQTFTATANTKLLKVDVGGSNTAQYTIYIAGNAQARKYTYFTFLNETFDFKDGLPVSSGDVISVEVVHNRPDPGNFNCNILILN